MGEVEAVTLSLLIERAFGVEERIDAADASTCMAEDEKIHMLLIL
jgi:hypothetical protein